MKSHMSSVAYEDQLLARCSGVYSSKENKNIVERIIKQNRTAINWDSIVSTAVNEMILPQLKSNLENIQNRAGEQLIPQNVLTKLNEAYYI